MGNGQSAEDGGAPEVPLPCDDAERWAHVRALDCEPAMRSLGELQDRMAPYVGKRPRVRGLHEVLHKLGDDGRGEFFNRILPTIVRLALRLPELRRLLQPDGKLRILGPRETAQLVIPRALGASLLANMFLCTFQHVAPEVMPNPVFLPLLASGLPHETAKLQMFVNFFDRLSQSETDLPGVISIDRIVSPGLDEAAWMDSGELLLPMEMAPRMVGFEEVPGLAHADFANKFIGGGVLNGGCVQEEIRFSICPELMLSLLVCPCMEPEEAIQINGAEQFSAYSGYAFELLYAGDHRDTTERRGDGSVKNSVLAMDALDLRGSDNSLLGQLSTKSMCRELNKSLAAFLPTSEEALADFRVVATGNWGCGAFLGCAPLKALIQWASASHCGRQLRYFPFDEHFGPELEALVVKATAKQITVGQLVKALVEIRQEMASTRIKNLIPPQKLIGRLEQRLALEMAGAGVGSRLRNGLTSVIGCCALRADE